MPPILLAHALNAALRQAFTKTSFPITGHKKDVTNRGIARQMLGADPEAPRPLVSGLKPRFGFAPLRNKIMIDTLFGVDQIGSCIPSAEDSMLDITSNCLGAGKAHDRPSLKKNMQGSTQWERTQGSIH